jgi:hypothetical protein
MMLYLGHFSSNLVRRDEKGVLEEASATFMAVAEAESPDEALDKLESLILKIKKTDEMFKGTLNIYLEQLVEVKKIPVSGFISFFTEGFPAATSSISIGPRGIPEKYYRCYTTGSEANGEADSEEEIVEPFLSFE